MQIIRCLLLILFIVIYVSFVESSEPECTLEEPNIKDLEKEENIFPPPKKPKFPLRVKFQKKSSKNKKENDSSIDENGSDSDAELSQEEVNKGSLHLDRLDEDDTVELLNNTDFSTVISNEEAKSVVKCLETVKSICVPDFVKSENLFMESNFNATGPIKESHEYTSDEVFVPFPLDKKENGEKSKQESLKISESIINKIISEAHRQRYIAENKAKKLQYSFDHTYSVQYKKYENFLDKICRKNKYCGEFSRTALSTFRNMELVSEVKKSTNTNLFENISYPLKDILAFLEENNELFYMNPESTDITDILNSMAFIKLYIALLDLLAQNRLQKERYNLSRKIGRKKDGLWNKKFDMDILFHNLEIRGYIRKIFLFREIGYSSQMSFDIYRYLLSMDNSNEDYNLTYFKKDRNNIRTLYTKLNKKFIYMHQSIAHSKEMQAEEFLEELDTFKKTGFVSFINNFLKTLDVTMCELYSFIKNQCKDENYIFILLYFRFGDLLMKRILLYSEKEDNAYLLVESFKEFASIMEDILYKNRELNVNAKIDEPDLSFFQTSHGFLYFLMFLGEVQIIRVVILSIKERLDTLLNLIENDFYKEEGEVDHNIFRQINKLAQEIQKKLDIGLDTLDMLNKNKIDFTYICKVLDKTDIINKKSEEMKDLVNNVYEFRSQDLKEAQKKVNKLYEEIMNSYHYIFNLS